MKKPKKHTVERHYDFQPGTSAVVLEPEKRLRIGIYSDSFDPVHAGHIVFALKAQKLANLEHIYFVPERRPRHDMEPEHYVHRRIMLKHALRPYRQFTIFDLPDARLTSRSLSRIIAPLPQADFSLLTTASELLSHASPLPALYHRLHLIIAVTSHEQMAEVLARLSGQDKLFATITFIDIGSTYGSASAIRHSLRSGVPVQGLLPSVWRYARKQWLYVPLIRHSGS